MQTLHSVANETMMDFGLRDARGGPLNSSQEDTLNATRFANALKQPTTKGDDERLCRICLSEEEHDNPFITPCQCTGSVKYIHLGCIREWLNGKMHKRETPQVNSYIWRGLECEICKQYYKDVIKHPVTGENCSLLNY